MHIVPNTTGSAEPRLIPFQLFAAVTAKRPKTSKCLPAHAVLGFLAKHANVECKEAAPLFILAEYTDPDKECRRITGIKYLHGIVGDFDHGDPALFRAGLDQLRELGVQAVAYMTFNSSPEQERWRVVVLLDKPVTPEEYRPAWENLNTIFGGCLDKNAKDPARLSYIASKPKGAVRRSILINVEVGE